MLIPDEAFAIPIHKGAGGLFPFEQDGVAKEYRRFALFYTSLNPTPFRVHLPCVEVEILDVVERSPGPQNFSQRSRAGLHNPAPAALVHGQS